MEFREVQNRSLRDIKQKASWPDDLEWLRQQIPGGGTPRWFLIRDQSVVASGFGIKGWEESILPAVELVAEMQKPR